VTGALIRVLIADDQRVVREGLTMLVGLIDGVEIVGTAADGAEAVELAERERPDVVLMDLRIPGMDGAAATRRIRLDLPDTQVLVLTTYADDDSLFPALQAGARGYLTKDASAEEIEQAIRALVAGRTYLDPEVQQRLVSPVLDTRHGVAAEPPTAPDTLTLREAEVLGLIAAGLSNAEIAEKLVVSADGEDARQPDLLQDRSARPSAGGALRLRTRPRFLNSREGFDALRRLPSPMTLPPAAAASR
jgi:DNA-binding NarL/FixJ family response regulator